MIDEYHKQLLEVIKEHDPEEYNDLMSNPYGGIVEDHLDALAEQFPTIEAFEKSYTDKEK